MRLSRVQHLVLAHRVERDQLDGRLRAGDPRHELCRTPRGHEPQQALRRREVPDVAGDDAVVAVEGELDAAAEHTAVDRGHGRVRQRPDPPEELVSGAAALDRLLAALDARKLLHVGPAGEASLLTGDDERREVTLLELGEQARERLERLASEDVRPARARPVVHGHERDGVDAIEVELGHRLGHGRRLSSVQ